SAVSGSILRPASLRIASHISRSSSVIMSSLSPFSAPAFVRDASTARRPLRALPLDYVFEGAPQRRGVGGVRLVLQRPEYAVGDGGDVGVTAPASDGEAVRHLHRVSVRVPECVQAGGFASPSLFFPQQIDLGRIDGRSIGVLL